MNGFEAFRKELEDVNMALLRVWPEARSDSERISMLQLRLNHTTNTLLQLLDSMAGERANRVWP